MRSLILVAAVALSVGGMTAARAWQRPASEDLRTRAWNAVSARVQDEKYLRHSLAVESVMREMADVIAGDRLTWGLAGLLHDIDLPETSADLSKHGLVGARMLADLQFPDPVVQAVKSHDDRSGVPRSSRLDRALFCADQGYWLVLATGLRFSSDAETVWKQARSLPAKQGVLKKVSAECPGVGLSARKVVALSLKGMRKAQ